MPSSLAYESLIYLRTPLECALFRIIACSFNVYRPKSDTCKTCDSLHVKIQAEQDPAVKHKLQGELAIYQAKAEGAYQQLKLLPNLIRL